MNDSQLRAVIGVILFQVDVSEHGLVHADTTEDYLDRAQKWLKSSYKNYQPPTGGTQQEVDQALALITSKGYTFTAPSEPSTPPQL